MAAPMSCLLGVVRFLRKMVEFRKSLNIMYYSGATLEDRFFSGSVPVQCSLSHQPTRGRDPPRRPTALAIIIMANV